jgi:hypothetical protein
MVTCPKDEGIQSEDSKDQSTMSAELPVFEGTASEVEAEFEGDSESPLFLL